MSRFDELIIHGKTALESIAKTIIKIYKLDSDLEPKMIKAGFEAIREGIENNVTDFTNLIMKSMFTFVGTQQEQVKKSVDNFMELSDEQKLNFLKVLIIEGLKNNPSSYTLIITDLLFLIHIEDPTLGVVSRTNLPEIEVKEELDASLNQINQICNNQEKGKAKE